MAKNINGLSLLPATLEKMDDGSIINLLFKLKYCRVCGASFLSIKNGYEEALRWAVAPRNLRM